MGKVLTIRGKLAGQMAGEIVTKWQQNEKSNKNKQVTEGSTCKTLEIKSQRMR